MPTARKTEGQASGSLVVRTRGRGLVEITREVRAWLDEQAVGTGMITLFCTHTSASLLIHGPHSSRSIWDFRSSEAS